MNTLLLWDIDGTLLNSGGAGLRAMRAALRTEFGIEGALDDVSWAGRTDRWIARQTFQKFGVEMTETHVQRLFKGYLAALPGEMGGPTARVLPGVPDLLRAIAARENATQGLLTGNLRGGAQIKLSYYGLWDFFPFGGFADDSEQRDDLGGFATARAAAWRGTAFHPDRVWVIGDTPHDIACGKAVSARTLGVATGHHTVEQLQAYAPTAVRADLTDTPEILNLLLT